MLNPRAELQINITERGEERTPFGFAIKRGSAEHLVTFNFKNRTRDNPETCSSCPGSVPCDGERITDSGALMDNILLLHDH